MVPHRVHPTTTQLGLLVAGFAFAAVTCLAEQPAKVELTALYSFLSSEAPDGDNSFHGHRVDLTVYKNRYFGLGGTLVNSQSRNTDLFFGPEFALLDKGRVGVRLHARAGAVQRLVRLNAKHDPKQMLQLEVWNFATATGFSVDVNVGKGWIWRVQPEIVWWRRGGTHTDFRLSTGIVVGWGKTG